MPETAPLQGRKPMAISLQARIEDLEDRLRSAKLDSDITALDELLAPI
jgi:hypothetical protein